LTPESTLPRVLLVDDELDFVSNLGQRLRIRGLPTLTATSGPEALASLGSEEVDVVVLDVRMPGMDGIQTLRKIKEAYPHIEVVMLTGHADLESSLEGMRFGFFDYLTKPVQIDTLVTKINDAYQRRLGNTSNTADTFSGMLKQHMIVADRLASLGELAASIAHEINNPLAIIAESTGWLKTRISRGNELPEHLESDFNLAFGKIESAVERARRISHNFLRFARNPDAVVREFDLSDLVAEVAELTGNIAAGRDVTLDISAAANSSLLASSDPFRLRQVLLNLVTNAVQAVAPGGSVSIQLHRREKEIEIAVIDNGPGIPEEDLERIFEPFFTTKPDGQGTGLGLAVSRGVVESLGGRIEVDSCPGRGCTFRVAIPQPVSVAPPSL